MSEREMIEIPFELYDAYEELRERAQAACAQIPHSREQPSDNENHSVKDGFIFNLMSQNAVIQILSDDWKRLKEKGRCNAL